MGYQCMCVSLDTGEKSYSTKDLQPTAPLPKAGQLHGVLFLCICHDVIWIGGWVSFLNSSS